MVIKRFDYPRLGKADKGTLLLYLRHTSGYSRQQLTRLVKAWHTNRLACVPVAKRYGPPKAPFERKYTSARGSARARIRLSASGNPQV